MAALPTLTNPGGVALFSQKNSQGLFTSQGLYKPNSVPEPSTLIIMAFALLSLMGLRALRQQASS
jgi:hypothetical protein